jgi:hypothetical protein
MLYPYRFVGLTIVLLATLVGVGFTHGLWTERWASSAQEILELENVPLTAGRWQGTTIEDKSSEQAFGNVNHYLLRRYVNRYDGTVGTVLLTRGRPGPMLIKHLPTECYISAGYELVGKPKRYISQIDDKASDEFWVATFKKNSGTIPVVVRVYWSWSGTGEWQIPDRPRFTFAKFPMLYKLYVIQNLPTENEPLEGAPIHDLIKELSTSMRGSIFASDPR